MDNIIKDILYASILVWNSEQQFLLELTAGIYYSFFLWKFFKNLQFFSNDIENY